MPSTLRLALAMTLAVTLTLSLTAVVLLVGEQQYAVVEVGAGHVRRAW